MITIVKKHNLNLKTDSIFNKLLKQFNNVVRFSYNRIIKDDITKPSELEQKVKLTMKNIDGLDASWIKEAVKLSTELYTDKKLYFGSKKEFFKRKYNKIDSLNKNNIPLSMRGSSDVGNRKASLIGNKLIFKPFKGSKYEINLKLSKKETKLLSKIQEGIKNKSDYFSFKIDNYNIYIMVNIPTTVETKHLYKQVLNRNLGIDLNPNWLALSISDINSKNQKIIFKEIIDLRLINQQSRDKKLYELTMINKHIIDLCRSYHVDNVCIEDLTIKSKDNKLGKGYNKLVNNSWSRNYQVNNLTKILIENKIKHLMVNPFYTSFIGQVKNVNDYDSVGASLEVAYRGFIQTEGIKSNVWVAKAEQDYVNRYLCSSLTTHWKEMLMNDGHKTINTWKEMYNLFKNLGYKNPKKQKKSENDVVNLFTASNSYRFLFNEVEKLKWSCLRLNSNKSLIDLIKI